MLVIIVLTAVAAVEAVIITGQLNAPLPPVRVERIGSVENRAAVLPQPPLSTTVEALGADGSELQIRSDPPGAVVYIDGGRQGQTPVLVRGLTLGPHSVRVVGRGSSIDQRITLKTGSTTLAVPLRTASTAVGWIEIDAPLDLDVVSDGQLIGSSAQKRLQLPAGTRRLELVNEAFGVRIVDRVSIGRSKVTRLSPELPTGLLNVNAQPWAEVLVDGRIIGTTPLANVPVAVGMREIVFRHPQLPEQRRRVLVTTRETTRLGVSMQP